jgi:pimeloyl-ACP methyl ester carboxylesterase
MAASGANRRDARQSAVVASHGWLIRLLLILVVLIAALAINTLVVDSRTRPAEPRDGGSIEDAGLVPANVKVEGNGPPLVLIHGFGAAIDWWDEVASTLAADHRVIRMDLIGHGGTEAPASGYEIERQAALVKAVLDQLGVDRVTVIGHSMGGEVATALAEADPARIERLVLIDSPPGVEATFNLMTRLAFTPVIGELLSRFETDGVIRKSLAQGFAPGFPVPERFVADFKQLTYTAFRSAHDASVAFRTERETPDRLKALDPVPPLLVIFGSRDALIPAASAKLFAAVPGARIEVIDGAGHSPMVEAPKKTISLITDFLAGR